MTIGDIWKLIVSLKDQISLGALVVVVLLSLIQVSKINWNPWDSILSWVGGKLNSNLKKEIDEVKLKLEQHIDESEKVSLENTRRDILGFCNACMTGRKHTQEQFRFVIKQCDKYETYIVENHVRNGEISSAIEEIRRLYANCLQKNSFLKEGEDNANNKE